MQDRRMKTASREARVSAELLVASPILAFDSRSIQSRMLSIHAGAGAQEQIHDFRSLIYLFPPKSQTSHCKCRGRQNRGCCRDFRLFLLPSTKLDLDGFETTHKHVRCDDELRLGPNLAVIGFEASATGHDARNRAPSRGLAR